MKFYPYLKSDILQIISLCKTSSKCASTQAAEVARSNPKLFPTKKDKVNLFTPNLNIQKLQELTNICAVTMAISHVSWAKISIYPLTVVDWDAYPLPSDFLNTNNESRTSILANKIKQYIPVSDLYIMENQKKWTSTLNEIYLRAMLIMLLHFKKDVIVEDKVIVQRAFVLNRTHKLLVGQERKSAKPIVLNLLSNINNINDIPLDNNDYPCWYSQLDIPEKHQKYFFSSAIEKQESLSLVLLLALSFLNKNYFENQEKFQIFAEFTK